MIFEEFAFDKSWIVQSEVHEDSRGNFRESFRRDKFRDISGLDFEIQQSNCSVSSANVLRGIHFSNSKLGQAKWISCIKGEIVDYVIDLRMESQTFGKWKSVVLSAENAKSIIIGSGMGHAFVVVSQEAIVSYSLTSCYDPSTEMTITPFDKDLGIKWPVETPILSDRDVKGSTLSELIASEKLPTGNLPL